MSKIARQSASLIKFELYWMSVYRQGHPRSLDGIYMTTNVEVVLPAVDASGTKTERFHHLFDAPSILEQIKYPLLHIDTDSTERLVEKQPYRARMDFMNF